MQSVVLIACTAALNPCPQANQISINAYVVTDSIQSSAIDAFLSGNTVIGVDWDVALYTFEGGFVFWCLGLGLGLVINTIRKAR